jgi:hypothetical protein
MNISSNKFKRIPKTKELRCFYTWYTNCAAMTKLKQLDNDLLSVEFEVQLSGVFTRLLQISFLYLFMAYHFHRSSQLLPILNQLCLVFNPTDYFFQIHFNNIPQPMPMSSKSSLSFKFCNNLIFVSIIIF